MTIDFEDLKVISFETRQADKIADLIIQAGGRPVVVPSMREVPLEQNTEALRFAKLLLAGWIDALALMTG
ncbi:MAG: uroporphyrinogen decarboxylase, partial [Deltaproteobacteria bacterium]|nr:uroporphyrinogen decarboxylase [Deltaproteobacteria bacterium]